MKFSVETIFQESLKSYRSHFFLIITFFLGVAIIEIHNIGLVYWIFQIPPLFSIGSFWDIFFVLLTFILAVIIEILFTAKLLDITKHSHTSNHALSFFFEYFLALILKSIVITVGFIFFIIPGIWLSVHLQFVGFAILDKKCSPIEAFVESYIITKHETFHLLLVWLLYTVIIIAGTLALGIGLLFAIPFIYVSQAVLYKKLSLGQHSSQVANVIPA